MKAVNFSFESTAGKNNRVPVKTISKNHKHLKTPVPAFGEMYNCLTIGVYKQKLRSRF